MTKQTAYLAVAAAVVTMVAGGIAASATPRLVVDEQMVPVTIGDDDVRLAVHIYRRNGERPLPTLIFHHGSTGWHTRPELWSASWLPGTVIHYFIDRGWAVAMPSRRGRGGSEGLYDEGLDPGRERYCWQPRCALAGAERALADVDAITDAILTMPFVDRARVIVGGQSRGGILSIAHAGRRPGLYRGVINFVGGWLAGASPVNRSLFERGVPFGEETLWLYANGDRFYSLANTRANFTAFRKAGGAGVFVDDFPDDIGHSLFGAAEYWGPVVDEYLARLVLPREPYADAVRFTPDPSLPAAAFRGRWRGVWGGSSRFPTALEISSVSSGWAVGRYKHRDELARPVRALVDGGVLRIFGGGRKPTVEFFVAREDVLIGTWRGEKKATRPRAYSRAVLVRISD